MNDNSVNLYGIDTIDVIDSIHAIDEKNGRKGGGIYYTDCPGQCVRCDGRNSRNAKDRCDEGIDDGDAMMHLLTEGLNDRGAAEEDPILLQC